MRTHVLKGSKQEIAATLALMPGEVREVIVFVEEPAPSVADAPTPNVPDIFAEMRPFMVDVQELDDSRQAVYTRMEGE